MSGKEIIVGCDLGGSIIKQEDENDEMLFSGPNYLLTPEVEGAIDELGNLVRATRSPNGRCNVHVISACNVAFQKRAVSWLENRQFTGRTGIPISSIFFCRQRTEKASQCAIHRISHFIDNRLEVLNTLETVPEKFLFRPNADEVRKFGGMPPQMRLADKWSSITNCILCIR